MNILDTYVVAEPSHQNALDIFKGEWSSKLPLDLKLTAEPGVANLFADSRVVWAEQVLGSFANQTILELGPLEGGHSYMFQSRHAEKVVAIEANTRAYLKCLCIKEILKLNRVEFYLGDFMPFLESTQSNFDIVFASGVLYHMKEPIKLLDLSSRISDRLYLWTHYYEDTIIRQNEHLSPKYGPLQSLEYDGISYAYATQEYQHALSWAGFSGGPEPISNWLTRDSILKALRHFGFVDIKINYEQIDHPHGPAFAICASK